jgi:hypothetical protein
LPAVHPLSPLIILHRQTPPPRWRFILPRLLLLLLLVLLLLALLLLHALLHLSVQLLIPLHFSNQAAPMHASKEGVLHDLVYAPAAEPLLRVICEKATQQIFYLGMQLRAVMRNSSSKAAECTLSANLQKGCASGVERPCSR